MASYYVTFRVEGRYVAHVEADSIDEARDIATEEFMTCNLNEMECIDGEPIIVEDENDIVWEAES